MKKKTPAQVARDRARRKSYWKGIKLAGQLRKAQQIAENLAAYYAQLQETRTVASPQVSVDSHPDNSGCVDTSTVSEPHRNLTVERETVNINQFNRIKMNCLPRRQNQNSQLFWTVTNWSLVSTSSISLPNQTRGLLLIHQTFAAIV